MAKTKAFAIFEGGGAKGIAHAGALKSAEKRFEFVGVAGTSAGAIMAALVAAGYTADEVFNPKDPNSILGSDLTQLLDAGEWSMLSHIKDRAKRKEEKRKKGNRKRKKSIKNGVQKVEKKRSFLGVARAFRYALTVSLLGFLFCLVYYGYVLVGAILVFTIASSSFIYVLRNQLMSICRMAFIWLAVHYHGAKNWRLLCSLSKRQGVMGTDPIREWLNELLRKKLQEKHPKVEFGKDILFRDITVPLKVIAADHEKAQIRVFSSVSDPTLSVADAVCASISIPFVFTPKKIGETEYIDGGIMSNFPAWVFDREIPSKSPFTPIIGFRLVSTDSRDENARPDFFNYLTSVALCSMFGDNKLETRKVGNLKEVLIPVKLGTLDFDAEPDDKETAYNTAFQVAETYLADSGNAAPESEVQAIFQIAEKAIRGCVAIKGAIRLCVFLPLSPDTLQVAFTFNMDSENDTDDSISFGVNQGAVGLCWRIRQPIICDLVAAKRTYKEAWEMTKYQQKLIRDDLESLLCLPIFRKADEDMIIGVLCIDSFQDNLEPLKDLVEKHQQIAASISQLVASKILSWGQK
jgi:NTE family protein